MKHLEPVDFALATKCADDVVVHGKLAIHDVAVVTWDYLFNACGFRLYTMTPTSHGSAGIVFRLNTVRYRAKEVTNVAHVTYIAAQVLSQAVGDVYAKGFAIDVEFQNTATVVTFRLDKLARQSPWNS